MAKNVVQKELKKKKKRWVSITAPKEFNNVIVGESLCTDPKLLIGRRINTSLMDLGGHVRRQNVAITLKATGVEGEQVVTEFEGYRVSPAHVKRIVRKSKDKLDDSFVYNTKDGIKVKIKLLILTRNKVQNSVLSALRKKAREDLTDNIVKQNFSELVFSVISIKLQQDLRSNLNKVYPLVVCEITSLEKVKQNAKTSN